MDETRTLYVLRHAKSSWDDPTQSDHDRPLAPRGRRTLKLLSAYIDEQRVAPELVICSTARRARETLEGLGLDGAVHSLERALYSAGAEDLLARLAQVDLSTRSVLIVGHNPALQLLVLRLATGGTAMPQALDEVRRKFPTGGLATLRFSCGWERLDDGCAQLVSFLSPKALQYG